MKTVYSRSLDQIDEVKEVMLLYISFKTICADLGNQFMKEAKAIKLIDHKESYGGFSHKLLLLRPPLPPIFWLEHTFVTYVLLSCGQSP